MNNTGHHNTPNGHFNNYDRGLANGSAWPSSSTDASAGSSPNSHLYSRSPANSELCTDSLLSSLLKIVDTEPDHRNNSEMRRTSPCDLRMTSPNGIRLSSPSSEYHRNSFNVLNNRCRDCVEQKNCRTCHRPATNNSLNGVELSMLQPLSSSALYCEIHCDAQRFYCQTCCKPYCSDCGVHLHAGHVTVHLMEAIEAAAIQANTVMTEAKQGIMALKEDLEANRLASEALEQKTQDAKGEVMSSMNKIVKALEARKEEIFEGIEKARKMKLAALQARDEALKSGITRLNKALERLTDAMDMSSLAGNPLDLLVTKDMASAEVFQIRQNRHSLPPPEESWISFTGGDQHIISAISTLGSIVVTNPGPIGDRRLRGRNGGTSPQFFLQNSSAPMPNQLVPLGPIPRGRAVSASTFRVSVRTGRAGQGLAGLFRPIKIIGNASKNEKDNLCRPWGVACDRDGHIIVADRSNNRIQIYRQDGIFLRRFGAHGTQPGQFDRPAGVAVDARRRIIVADKDNHRIQILTMEGNFLLSFGGKGNGNGQFNYPWDVAVNSECQIVVSDTRNHRVQLFSPEGIFLRKYGYENAPNMWKHFDSPRGVAFNPEGNVVLTDFNNHRLVIIDADFMNARVLGCGSDCGKSFSRPQGLVIDDEGNIIVADSKNHRIQIFDSAGTLKWKFGSHGDKSDEMDRPSGIALTPDGRIAVVDFGNNRVMII